MYEEQPGDWAVAWAAREVSNTARRVTKGDCGNVHGGVVGRKRSGLELERGWGKQAGEEVPYRIGQHGFNAEFVGLFQF